ncbi:MAG: hypothetical protein M1588_00565 [Planctomycetes bacterium]|nr:hypothetical protein [Planctomycetota bacterium]
MTTIDKPRPTIPLGTRDQIYLGSLGTRATRLCLGVGLLALAGAAVLGAGEGDAMRQFLFGYLTAWCFFFSIAAASLFFVLAHHLFKASWSVVLRRLAETLACNFIPLMVLLLPILFGLHRLYPWTSAAYMHSSADLQNKSGLLNEPFFLIRCLFYFILLIGLSWYFRRQSLAQDHDGRLSHLRALRWHSGWGFLALFWIINFIGADLVMTLQPRWLSYAAPLFFFSGVIMTIYAALPLLAMWLQRNGRLDNAITLDHYQDLARWLFAWMMFWMYIAFAQYMLIWYANIPQETSFFLVRDLQPWLWITLALLFGHFIMPFLGLLPRWAKRNKRVLAFWCVWLLLFGYLDLFWQIMPAVWVNTPAGRVALQHVNAFDPYQLAPTARYLLWIPLSTSAILIDVLCLLGIGGLFLAHTFHLLRQEALLPLKDPHLPSSLVFEELV